MFFRRPANKDRRRAPRYRLPGLRREEGQAAFEFMLVLPFFILAVLLIVDLSMAMYHYVSLSNAVREGARYASVNCRTGECSVDAVQDLTVSRSGGIPLDKADLTVEWADTNSDGVNAGRGDAVIVKGSHIYDFLFFPGSLPVVSCSDMRLEQRDKSSGLPWGSGC